MGDMIQYVGSLFSGGMIMLMLIMFFAGIGDTAVTQTFSSVVQENLTSSTEGIEQDLRLIGYGVNDSDKVLLADTSRLIYRADVDGINHVDTVMYELGPVLAWGNGNPQARILYRSVDGAAPIPVATGVTQFRIQYFDSTGVPTVVEREIRSLAIAMTMESDTRLEGAYPGVVWERTLKPKNLR